VDEERPGRDPRGSSISQWGRELAAETGQGEATAVVRRRDRLLPEVKIDNWLRSGWGGNSGEKSPERFEFK